MNKNVTDLRNSDLEIPKRFVKPYIIKKDNTKSEKLPNRKQFQIIRKKVFILTDKWLIMLLHKTVQLH